MKKCCFAVLITSCKLTTFRILRVGTQLFQWSDWSVGRLLTHIDLIYRLALNRRLHDNLH